VSGRPTSVTRQPLAVTSHATKAATASGSDSSMAKSTIPNLPNGCGTGSAITAGCPASGARNGASGTYAAWVPDVPAAIAGAKAAFTAS
jgi:hypothetical protein